MFIARALPGKIAPPRNSAYSGCKLDCSHPQARSDTYQDVQSDLNVCHGVDDSDRHDKDEGESNTHKLRTDGGVGWESKDRDQSKADGANKSSHIPPLGG